MRPRVGARSAARSAPSVTTRTAARAATGATRLRRTRMTVRTTVSRAPWLIARFLNHSYIEQREQSSDELNPADYQQRFRDLYESIRRPTHYPLSRFDLTLLVTLAESCCRPLSPQAAYQMRTEQSLKGSYYLCDSTSATGTLRSSFQYFLNAILHSLSSLRVLGDIHFPEKVCEKNKKAKNRPHGGSNPRPLS